jgi:hypothetical protein
MCRQQAGDALDHHLAGVVLGLADQRDARLRLRQRDIPHPSGAGPRLARAAAAEHEPDTPTAGRLALMRMGECAEIRDQPVKRLQLGRRDQMQQQIRLQ